MKQQYTTPPPPKRNHSCKIDWKKGQEWGRNQKDINGDEGRSNGQHSKEEIKSCIL